MCGGGSETGGGGGGGGEKTEPQKTKPQPSSPPPGHPEYNKTAGSKPEPTTTPSESNGGEETGTSNSGEDTSHNAATHNNKDGLHPVETPSETTSETTGETTGETTEEPEPSQTKNVHPSEIPTPPTGGEEDGNNPATLNDKDGLFPVEVPGETGNFGHSSKKSKGETTGKTVPQDPISVDQAKTLAQVHDKDFKGDAEYSKASITMHTVVKEGTVHFMFKGMNPLNPLSVVQSVLSFFGFKAIGQDKFVEEAKKQIELAKKEHGDDITVLVSGFSQGGHLAMDLAAELAEHSLTDSQIKMGNVLAIDSLGLLPNNAKKFNEIAKKTDMTLTSVSNEHESSFVSKFVTSLREFPNGTHLTFNPEIFKGDKVLGHNGVAMAKAFAEAMENNNADGQLLRHSDVGDHLVFIDDETDITPSDSGDSFETDKSNSHSITVVTNQIASTVNNHKGAIILEGSAKNDVMTSDGFPNASAVALRGKKGDDTLTGHAGADMLYGDDGNDVLNGGAGTDVLTGGAGADQFVLAHPETSKAKADVITDFEAIDTLTFANDQETIWIKRAKDDADNIQGVEIYADANQAKIVGYLQGYQDLLSEANLTNPDIDIKLIDEAHQHTWYVQGAKGVTINGGHGIDIVHGGRGKDTIFGKYGNDVINGKAGDDVIDGGYGDDVIDGGFGNDVIDGRTGQDKIYGDDGHDTIDGGAGHDILDGNFGDDVIYGGAGNDKIYGGFGNDRLEGGAGHDTIYGNRGDDVIRGMGGKDVLYGGGGADQFVLSKSDKGTLSNSAIIKDFVDGQDKLALDATLTFSDISLTASKSHTVIGVKGTNDVLALIDNISVSNLTEDDFVTLHSSTTLEVI